MPAIKKTIKKKTACKTKKRITPKRSRASKNETAAKKSRKYGGGNY
tara:strand:+ start:756 stop:893 length:138 start_codon:yes stop_codon:yes gene_type:complete